jgi:hypothetical protein
MITIEEVNDKNNPALFLALKTVAVNADFCSVVSDNIPEKMRNELIESIKHLNDLLTLDKFGFTDDEV